MGWTISKSLQEQMIENCVKEFPLEACGIFLGPINESFTPTGEILEIWPASNIEKSARIYSVDPQDIFNATKYANEKQLEIVGIYHSHTHSQAYPSPTDIEKSVDKNWCYTIVSLAEDEVIANYFQIINSEVKKIDIELL
ncbi:MAG: M67 family metallopeptidase [Acidimicrobiia bacterium]